MSAKTAFYCPEELRSLGVVSFGRNVLVSRKSSLYYPENIVLGNNVRIDDFCIISAKGGVKLGDYVHIGAYSALYGASGIEINDYSGLSPRCTLFSESDDFSGESLMQPFFTDEFKPGYLRGKITIDRFTNLGAGTTVLPGSSIGEGVVTGAHSLVKGDLQTWWMYWGTPARKQKERSRKIQELSLRHFQTKELS